VKTEAKKGVLNGTPFFMFADCSLPPTLS